MSKICGTCTLCCRVVAVADLDKPAHVQCTHCLPGKGCTIYGSHPVQCQQFRCGWLDNPNLGDEWQPDQCGIVLRMQSAIKQMVVDVDPHRPDAWRRQPYHNQIRLWAQAMMKVDVHVVVYVGRRAWAVFPEEEIDVGQLAEGEVPVSRYEQVGAMRRPAVRILNREGAGREIYGSARLAPAGPVVQR
jgi:hypothetical protein